MYLCITLAQCISVKYIKSQMVKKEGKEKTLKRIAPVFDDLPGI